jgi:hypothetical protein
VNYSQFFKAWTAYTGKGKRTGTPGHFEYEYGEEPPPKKAPPPPPKKKGRHTVLPTWDAPRHIDFLLVGCSKSKVEHDRAVPVRELYRKDLWNKRKGYAEARERQGTPWAVASAGLGVVDPETRAQRYDVEAKDLKGERRAAWVQSTRGILGKKLPHGGRLEVIAGRDYVAMVREAVVGMGIEVVNPLKSVGTGDGKHWLAEQTAKLDAEQEPEQTTMELRPAQQQLALFGTDDWPKKRPPRSLAAYADLRPLHRRYEEAEAAWRTMLGAGERLFQAADDGPRTVETTRGTYEYPAGAHRPPQARDGVLAPYLHRHHADVLDIRAGNPAQIHAARLHAVEVIARDLELEDPEERAAKWWKPELKRFQDAARALVSATPTYTRLRELFPGKRFKSEKLGGALDDLTTTRRGLAREADALDIPLRRYFPSGSNHAGEIRGFAALGMNVGVAVDQINKGSLEAIAELKGQGTQVFVDSGAFGEVKFNFPNKKGKLPRPDLPMGPYTVKPITHEDWVDRLALYDQIVDSVGSQAHVVAPDKIADQPETLARMTRYAPEMQALRRKGANVLAPLQGGGALSLAQFEDKATEALGFDDYVRAIPMKSNATSLGDLEKYLTEKTPKRVHLLGIGPHSDQFPAVREIVQRVSPGTSVTLDSVAITAAVGRPKSKRDGALLEPRKLSRATDWVRREMDPFHDTAEDYTDLIGTPSEWMPIATQQSVARDLTASGLDGAAFLRDPDEWLQESPGDDDDGAPPHYELPEVALLLDQTWESWWAGREEHTASIKQKAVMETWAT